MCGIDGWGCIPIRQVAGAPIKGLRCWPCGCASMSCSCACACSFVPCVHVHAHVFIPYGYTCAMWVHAYVCVWNGMQMWKHGDQWPCMPCIIVTKCPCIMCVLVPCVQTYSCCMHDLSCGQVCRCIHGAWIHVSPIIGVFVPGHTWSRGPSCMHVDMLRGMHPN